MSLFASISKKIQIKTQPSNKLHKHVKAKAVLRISCFKSAYKGYAGSIAR